MRMYEAQQCEHRGKHDVGAMEWMAILSQTSAVGGFLKYQLPATTSTSHIKSESRVTRDPVYRVHYLLGYYGYARPQHPLV